MLVDKLVFIISCQFRYTYAYVYVYTHLQHMLAKAMVSASGSQTVGRKPWEVATASRQQGAVAAWEAQAWIDQATGELMWVKQCHKSPMTGNGNHTTFKNSDDWGPGGWFIIVLATWTELT